MARDERKSRNVAGAAAARGRVGFNPLWLVDLAGAAGLSAFAWSVGWAAHGPLAAFAAPVRDAGLLFVGTGVVVRALDFSLRRRDTRREGRGELLRRLARLNDALLDLRKSLDRDSTRRFLERRTDFTAGLALAQRRLSREEAALARACESFCEPLAAALSETVYRRTTILALADRLRRELDRAGRRDDLDPAAADAAVDLVDDAVAVMEEAIYAEWNADHFGRLAADRRGFGAALDRCDAAIADRLERRGNELFDRLVAHVNHKIEVADLVEEWEQTYRRLEARMGGLPDKPTKPRLARAPMSERFAAAPSARPIMLRERPLVRLPAAAND